MKILLCTLLLLLGLLQYKAWFSNVGYFAASSLKQELATQQSKELELQAKNTQLVAQVIALKTGLEAVESMAREDLGMIKNDERFFFVTDADEVIPLRASHKRMGTTHRPDP